MSRMRECCLSLILDSTFVDGEVAAKLLFLTIYLKTYLGINGLVFENEGWLLLCDFFDGFHERVFAIEEIEIDTYHVVDISATLNLDATSLSVFKGVSS